MRTPPAASRPGSAHRPVSYIFDDVHSPAALIARQALRHTPRVLSALEAWWTTALNSMSSDRASDAAHAAITCEEYVKMWCKIHRAMILEWDEADATIAALREWKDDIAANSSGGQALLGGGQEGALLGCERFKDAIFELSDLWTAGVDEVEYSAFLWQLLHHIAEGEPPNLYFWRPTGAITHGGYSSPKKARPEIPSPRLGGMLPSPRSGAAHRVDVLILGADGNDTCCTYTDGEGRRTHGDCEGLEGARSPSAGLADEHGHSQRFADEHDEAISFAAMSLLERSLSRPRSRSASAAARGLPPMARPSPHALPSGDPPASYSNDDHPSSHEQPRPPTAPPESARGIELDGAAVDAEGGGTGASYRLTSRARVRCAVRRTDGGGPPARSAPPSTVTTTMILTFTLATTLTLPQVPLRRLPGSPRGD